MVLASNHFLELKSSSLDEMPASLKNLINKVREQHYEELYEPEADGTTSLQDSLNEVLEAFRISNHSLCHLRYVWMALILTLLVEPTVEYYQPSNSLPKDIIRLITFWLFSTIKNLATSEINNTKFSIRKLNYTISNNHDFTAQQEPVSFQIINESIDVFKKAILVLDYDQSIEAILEILDDCLEGYAVFPGSYGRRELFDWWIIEVVPASWFLLPPKSLYVVEGLQNQEEIQLRQTSLLKQISDAMWFFFQEGLASQLEANRCSIYNSNSIKQIKMNLEIQSGKFNLNHSITNLTESEPVVFPV